MTIGHKLIIQSCRDHGDELNDTKKSVIWFHNRSATLISPLRCEISALRENEHGIALLTIGARIGLYLLWLCKLLSENGLFEIIL